jgi:hypothetical protein
LPIESLTCSIFGKASALCHDPASHSCERPVLEVPRATWETSTNGAERHDRLQDRHRLTSRSGALLTGQHRFCRPYTDPACPVATEQRLCRDFGIKDHQHGKA